MVANMDYKWMDEDEKVLKNWNANKTILHM